MKQEQEKLWLQIQNQNQRVRATLERLLRKGLITPEEYTRRSTEIISRIDNDELMREDNKRFEQILSQCDDE